MCVIKNGGSKREIVGVTCCVEGRRWWNRHSAPTDAVGCCLAGYVSLQADWLVYGRHREFAAAAPFGMFKLCYRWKEIVSQSTSESAVILRLLWLSIA